MIDITETESNSITLTPHSIYTQWNLADHSYLDNLEYPKVFLLAASMQRLEQPVMDLIDRFEGLDDLYRAFSITITPRYHGSDFEYHNL